MNALCFAAFCNHGKYLSRDEDFSEADIVLTTLGDPGVEKCMALENRSRAKPGNYFIAEDL
jgi:hypothetical protein